MGMQEESCLPGMGTNPNGNRLWRGILFHTEENPKHKPE